MDAIEIREELIPEIQEAISFVAAGYSIRDLGEEFEHLSEWFQALAISHILRTADPARFCDSLTRSAHARRYYLRKCHEEGVNNDRHLAVSRTEAFLDACAAGSLTLARELADLSLKEFHPNWEYEDDFLYRTFLQRLLQSYPEAELTETLKQFERSLEGASSPRLKVCAALLRRDTDGLRSSVSALMDHIQEKSAEQRARAVEHDPVSAVSWARSFVSIEGLSILRIADTLDLHPMELGEEFPMCPAIALESVGSREYDDIFQGLERELARQR